MEREERRWWNGGTPEHTTMRMRRGISRGARSTATPCRCEGWARGRAKREEATSPEGEGSEMLVGEGTAWEMEAEGERKIYLKSPPD